MTTDFTVKKSWRKESYGQVFTAKAVAATGRVLAVVNVEVPLDIEIDIRTRFGSAWVDEIEGSAVAQVTQAAKGWDQRAG